MHNKQKHKYLDIDNMLDYIVEYIHNAIGVEASVSGCNVGKLERALAMGVVEKLSVEDIAKYCSMSMSTFKRRCIDYYGLSPHRLIINCRMALAIKLLKTTILPLSEIAQRCGYATVSHFIATFRRHHGTTPSCYRRLSASK